MRKSYPLLISVLFAISFLPLHECSSTKNIPPRNLSFTAISFGKSGGFTNQMEKYTIQSDGRASKISPESEITLKKISPAELETIDTHLETTGFADLILNEVGNMTYFIELENEDFSKKVTWTDATESSEIKAFYKTLISLIK